MSRCPPILYNDFQFDGAFVYICNFSAPATSLLTWPYDIQLLMTAPTTTLLKIHSHCNLSCFFQFTLSLLLFVSARRQESRP